MIDISRADAAQLPAVGLINYLSTIDTYPDFIPTFNGAELSAAGRTATLENWFANPQSPRAILVAADGDTPVGYSAFSYQQGSRAELTSLHVHPEHRRRQIGRQLFAATVAELVALTTYHMTLEAYQANPFRHFYRQMGGAVTRRFSQEKYGSTMEVVVYQWDDLRRFPLEPR